MKRMLIILAIVTAHMSVAVVAEDVKPQETCPIGGEPINKAFFLDVDSTRIFVCSTSCIEQVKIDTAGAIDALKQRGEKPAQLQTHCPVMEEKAIKKTLYVDHAGKRVYVCCKKCEKTVTDDPETYIAKLEAQGILLEHRQVKCPVMPEEDVAATYFVDYDSKRLYLCCDDCVTEVAGDPGKYFGQVEAEGITLDKAD